MIIIIIEKRSDGYMAFLEGHPEIWGCGKDPDDAIMDLISSHNEKFLDVLSVHDVEIIYSTNIMGIIKRIDDKYASK